MVTVKLDKERHLRLTLRGMREYKTQTGLDLLKGFDMKKMNFDEISALMWACLLDEDRELKYDDFLDIVDLSNLPDMRRAIVDCINEALPDKKESGSPLVKRRSRRG